MYSLDRKLPITLEELKVCKASPMSRIGGAILDSIIELSILFGIVFIFLAFASNVDEESIIEYTLTFTIIFQVISFFLNLIVPMITKGQTIGKRAAGTRIIGVDGNIGNLVLYLVRSLFYTFIGLVGQIPELFDIATMINVVVLVICFIMLFSDDHGRTLQDRFARTMVVHDRIYKAFREKRFYEIDHPKEMIIIEEESPYESIQDKEDFI